MKNGIFKPLGYHGYARAADVMSTKSGIGFEWSIKLNGTSTFCVGIASQLKPEAAQIISYDQNSILYCTWALPTPDIGVGINSIHSNLPKHKTGDVIRFRFQPSSLLQIN